MNIDKIIQGDCLEVLKSLPDGIINTCITSPPYFGLRDYGVDGQIGLEETPDQYVAKLVEVFREVRRVLRDDGTLWLNLGDSYASVHTGGHKSAKSTVGANKVGIQEIRQTKAKPNSYGLKEKDIIGIPWRVAFALQADGWYLRQDIIWHKPNPMPESVTDRCTKAHEYIFLLSKSARYFFDADAIKEPNSPTSQMGGRFTGNKKSEQTGNGHSGLKVQDNTWNGRNRRSVWTVTTKPFKEAHFATFPEDLIKPCILAGCPENGVVYDPFMGAGTTAYVSKKLGRHFLGSELNPEYINICNERINSISDSLFLSDTPQ